MSAKFVSVVGNFRRISGAMLGVLCERIRAHCGGFRSGAWHHLQGFERGFAPSPTPY
jgi:hypothetical protein